MDDLNNSVKCLNTKTWFSGLNLLFWVFIAIGMFVIKLSLTVFLFLWTQTQRLQPSEARTMAALITRGYGNKKGGQVAPNPEDAS